MNRRVCAVVFVLGVALLSRLTLAQEKKIPVRTQIEQRFGQTVDVRYDQPYADNTNPRQMVDVYLPKMRATERPLPIVVFIHGGGWSGGHRDSFGLRAAALASKGEYAAVSVGYRLSDEAIWPSQLHDCKAAIRWIRGQAKELNLDPDRIGATGTSAGGHLVTLLGLTGNRSELEGDVGRFKSWKSNVTCVVNFCGPTDLIAPLMQGEAATKDDPAVSGLIGGSPKEKVDIAIAASPLTYVSSDAVPIMSVHGTNDLRVNFTNAEKLDAALKKAGTQSWLIPMVNAGHGIPIEDELADRIQKFWDLHLRGIKAEISRQPIAVALQKKS